MPPGGKDGLPLREGAVTVLEEVMEDLKEWSVGVRSVDVPTVIILGPCVGSKECKCGLHVTANPSITEAECSWVWLWFREHVQFPTVVCKLGPRWLLLLSNCLDVVLCTDSTATRHKSWRKKEHFPNIALYMYNVMSHVCVHVRITSVMINDGPPGIRKSTSRIHADGMLSMEC